MKTILAMSILFIIIIISCNVNETKISKNFRCKIDGKKWTAYASDWKASAIRCEISKDLSSLTIHARNSSSSENVSIILYPESGKLMTGVKYPLNSNSYRAGSYSMQRNIQFLTDSENTGEFEILEIDTTTYMIKGKFHFNCLNTELKKIVKISDGTFNTTYYQY